MVMEVAISPQCSLSSNVRMPDMNFLFYGLRRSSLIMGVHPGCPVCSTVAASFVAVVTDVGETISATKVAFVCGLWSIGVVALLSVGFFFLLLRSSTSLPLYEVLVESTSLPHAVGCKALRGLSIDVKCVHVSLADILVAQLWAFFGSSRCQLSIENVFWELFIFATCVFPVISFQ